MTLEPIGDIANATLSEQVSGTITWETATDWDNQTSRTNTEHEPERDEETVRLGKQNTEQSPLAFHRFHSGSGSTLVDLSGNNNDGTIEGASWDSAPSPRFAGSLNGDGVDDQVNCGSVYNSGNSFFEAELWFYPQSTGQQKTFEQDRAWSLFYDRSGNQDMNIAIFGDAADLGPSLALDTWHHVYAYWDIGNEVGAIINGSTYTSSSETGLESDSANFGWFDDPDNDDDPFDGKIAEGRVFQGDSRAITSAEDSLYVQSGDLLTATQSFDGAVSPSFTDLDYSLNGETITLDAIGSPGTADEETVSQTLDGASSYSLSWSASHADYRVRINHSTGDATVTPQINSISLSA